MGPDQTPEALRDSDVARHVLDACLAVVRVDLQERDRVLAVHDAHRCRRLVPDLAPRESTHSAQVVGALAEAENELRRAGAGALSIETGASQPCAVFVNGRRLGTAPFRYELEEHQECLAAESGDCGAVKQQGDRYLRASYALIGVAGGLAGATVAAFFIEGKRRRAAQIPLRAAPGGLGIATRF
jgi:hypothetical protein